MKVLIAVAALFWLSVLPIGAQPSTGFDPRPQVNANGEAVINVTPDRIVIRFGIETLDKDIVAAKQKNNDILKTTVAALKEAGIPDKEIQTDHLSIEPQWLREYGKLEFIGFRVRNTLVVSLAAAEQVEEMVTKALQSGVNYVHGIDYQSTKFREYRDQARGLAIQAAREKAEAMAAALGQSIGAPLRIIEEPGRSSWWYSGGWWGGRSGGMTSNRVLDAREGIGEMVDTVVLGTITIRASVSVVFELKD